MFLYFNIRNFKSILDLKLDLNFQEGKAPNGYKDLPFYVFFNIANTRVIPTASIYGANASGKSNILKAIGTFKNVVKNGIENNFYPNKINNKYNTTNFGIKFSVNNKIYDYIVEYDGDKIWNENLKLNNVDLFKCENSKLKIFSKKTEIYNSKKLSEIYNVECNNSNENQVFTFLSKIARNYANLDKNIFIAYNYLVKNIAVYISNYMSFSAGIESLVKFNNSTETEQLARITKIIKKFDIDINSLTFEKKEFKDFSELEYDLIKNSYERTINPEKGKMIYSFINSYHNDIDGNEVIFNFKDESDGTKSLAGIIGIVLLTLDKGGVLFVDELEKSLHPLLLMQIIRLFKDKDYNKLKAQLIFTTHNTDILDSDLLRVSEIMITNKTNKNGTTIHKLSDYSNIRNVTNFRKRYLNGEFMGIPYSYI